MELRHLRYFVAVAEAGNLSRAAEKLFIAQPPLSLQIRQLEEEVGSELFIRHPKGMRLTPVGEALLPQARDLLDRAQHLAERARLAAPAASIGIGFVPSAANTVLPGVIRRLRAVHPDVDIRLEELISDEQRDALIGGRIDAGIVRGAARHPRLAAACSIPDPFCLAVPSARAKALQKVIDLRHHATDDYVAFTRHRGPAYFDRAIQLCGRAGFSPRIRFEASTLHGVLALVSAELGVALVPATAALLAVRGVTVRRLRYAARDEMLSLVHRRNDARPVVAALLEAAATSFAEVREQLG